ncbi:hypothetical protein SAMN06265375_102237 [Muriicola jejuensis]|uniref:Uncharacterized protein n=1 Tax=Muriicola jejuensis TaxID=504488 RepID=A0A6P0UDT5_9FLAO|nr:hypothetical protein [Muriicola jejuensis]NER10782.1 hypothetical protein [Muriicola jejuensis]SMP16259.1 hypothetical protein SAMN06265375_102237 [Muriicola jejuensis]
MRKTYFFLSFGVFLLCLYLLFSASPALEYPLGKNDTIPLGSFITWAGLIALPMSFYWGSVKFRTPEGTLYNVLSTCLKVTIFLALLWLPISYGLAGNMNFNFGQEPSFQGGQTAMKLFWGITYSLVLSSLILFILHIVLCFFRRTR